MDANALSENLKYGFNGTYSCDDFVFFWSHRSSENDRINETCLSQWWECSFSENGFVFCCAEQYMMYYKALLFGDEEYAKKITKSTDPKKIKEYGRLIRNFDEHKWHKERCNIVLRGNILKFSQNKNLYDYLMSTGDKILVEASPYDKIWGIGMEKSEEGICEPSKWKGTNLLGFTLMEVRKRLSPLN